MILDKSIAAKNDCIPTTSQTLILTAKGSMKTPPSSLNQHPSNTSTYNKMKYPVRRRALPIILNFADVMQDN